MKAIEKPFRNPAVDYALVLAIDVLNPDVEVDATYVVNFLSACLKASGALGLSTKEVQTMEDTIDNLKGKLEALK
jgi:hypothetical protein